MRSKWVYGWVSKNGGRCGTRGGRRTVDRFRSAAPEAGASEYSWEAALRELLAMDSVFFPAANVRSFSQFAPSTAGAVAAFVRVRSSRNPRELEGLSPSSQLWSRPLPRRAAPAFTPSYSLSMIRSHSLKSFRSHIALRNDSRTAGQRSSA